MWGPTYLISLGYWVHFASDESSRFVEPTPASTVSKVMNAWNYNSVSPHVFTESCLFMYRYDCTSAGTLTEYSRT
jgi:hypothetical protein